MIYRYKGYDWNSGKNKTISTPIQAGGGFSGCCGSKWLGKSPKELTNPKGIAVVGCKLGEEKDDTFDAVKHLETKNGTITIAIRKKW